MRLDETVKQLASNVQGDLAKLGDLDGLFEQITKERGRLHIVSPVQAASYGVLGSIDEQHFDSIFDGNVKGLVFTVQKALPLSPNGGSIILTLSIVGSKGLPANSDYAASKAAIRSFAGTWKTDIKARKIRINAISPGATDTEGLRELLGSEQVGRDQDRLKALNSVAPMGRLGRRDEIAKAALFLASDDSSYVTGTELFADGGFAQV